MSPYKFFVPIAILALTPLMHSCGGDSKTPPPPPKESQQSEKSNTPPPLPEKISPANEEDDDSSIDINRLSEAFGHFIGRNLTNPGAEFSIEPLITGIRNGASGKPQPMNNEEYEQMMGAFQEKAFQKMADKNLNEANTFLETNRSKSGVVEEENGKLQYIILQAGEGEPITSNDTIKIRYKGMYIDGTQFGSSDDTGGTVTLSPEQTIPGFRKGIAGMKKGEKRKIFVHPDLGYGTMGQLPPNQLLIFEVELLEPNAEPPRLSFSNLPEEPEYEDEEEEEYEYAEPLDSGGPLQEVPRLGENDPNVGEYSRQLGNDNAPVPLLGEQDRNVGDFNRQLGD